MAFYEMLPGAGMPPGLQAGMDSVLNKKFGTSTTYPAEDWPDTVNLMGPLPEKTASGAIVTFPDGADAVPLKSLVANLPASLTPYEEVEITHAGKNLFNVADYSQIYTDRDGVDSYNYRYMIIQLKPNTTYTVSQNSGEYSGTPIILINNALPVGGANYFDLRKASDTKTYTTDSTGRLYIGSVNSYDDVAYERLQVCKVQIEAGSSATDYEPYTAPTTHTASLGRTIYGGTADVVKGEGVEDRELVTYTDGTGWTTTAEGFHYIALLDKYKVTGGIPLLNNGYTGVSPRSYTALNEYEAAYATGVTYLNIKDTRYTTDAAWDTYLQENPLQIAYPLFYTVSFSFTPTPIDSKLGNNTLWSEQGSDTKVTYRADINLALGGN